ncbi:MAG TPA: hypothetical protein VFS00_12805 [Polyangiaceae bacterium]|nr:hypothetical protein [Polyangiaceae bacterium]
MRSIRPLLCLVAALPLALAACGGDDDVEGGGAPGSVTFTTYGEDDIEQQIPAADVADGWTITYDKFLIVLGNVKVAAASGEVGGQMSGLTLFNMKAPGDKAVASFDVAARTWDEVSYQIGPYDASAALGPGATDADRAFFSAPNASVYVAGSAAKGGVTKTFKWLFTKPTAFERCEGEKDTRFVVGAVVTSGATDEIQLTIHGDHLFYDDLQSPDALLRFDPLAAADANGDNEVTLDELRAVKLADLTVGTYGTGSADINDLGAFVEALSQTVGHFRGEGECKSKSL